MHLSSPTIAVIDVGSNSIKLLVSALDNHGHIQVLYHKSEETRLALGISNHTPMLTKEAIAAGLSSVHKLLKAAQTFNPKNVLIVATSAVREAHNQDIFKAKIEEETGYPLRILSGEEEALYIAKGVSLDENLKNVSNACVFDLGGGSLELIHYENKKVLQALSLPLGCVRVMELFVQNPSEPMSSKTANQIDAYITQSILNSNFQAFSAEHNNLKLVGLGGAFTVARSILFFGACAPICLNRNDLSQLFASVATKSLSERLKIPGLPASRGDILPTALAITLSLIRLSGQESLYYSYHSLRFGLAYELLKQIE